MNHAKTLVAAMAAMASGAVGAQDQRGPQSGTTNEVVVTARRIEERLQEVPVAVTAFSAVDITRRNLQQLEDVALATAGFSFEDYGGGFGVPVIRGGSQLRVQDLDATTSVYLDGVYLPRQYMIDLGLVGFERIEIVKGPQSALYGRNAFLGAVNYVSGGPSDDLKAEARVNIGTDELYEISGEIGGEVIEGRLGARIVAAYSEFDGTWKNQHPNAGINFGRNGTSDNMGGWERSTVGLNLEGQITDRLAFDLDYYHVERFQEQEWSVRTESSAGDTNCAPTLSGGTVNRFYCGEIPDKFVPLPGGSPVGTESITDPRGYLLDVETDFIQTRLAYKFSDTWSATYQFGYADSTVTAAGSGDRDPLLGSANFFGGDNVNYINVTPNGANDFVSNELRVEFNSGQWSAFVGVFTSDLNDFDRFDFGLAPLLGTEPLAIDPNAGLIGGSARFVISRVRTTVDTDAIFGRVAYESADARWRIGAEARYSDEEKTLDSNTDSLTNPIFNDNWTAFTPRFTADYRLTDINMVYASIAKGVKSGGFNNVVFDESQRSYDPDENWTYEIGSKNEFLDGRLRMNLAVFFTDWQDLQINSTPIGLPPGAVAPALVANTGGAEIWGAELEGSWAPLDNFALDYAVSYANAEYTSGSKSARIGLTGGCDGIVCPADGSIGGNQLQRQPDLQANVGAAFNGIFSGDWEWYARADVTYQARQYIDELNLAWVPARTLVNTRFELQRGQWTAALWAKNLFDEEYVANAFFVATPTATSYAALFGAQRTAGLSISFAL